MEKTITSHDFAKQLRKLAEFLEAAPAFKLPDYSTEYNDTCGIAQFDYHYDKAGFISAVKALGSGKKREKTICQPEIHFMAADGLLRLAIYKEALCRLIEPAKPAVYECEPLLSQAEEAQIDGAA